LFYSISINTFTSSLLHLSAISLPLLWRLQLHVASLLCMLYKDSKCCLLQLLQLVVSTCRDSNCCLQACSSIVSALFAVGCHLLACSENIMVPVLSNSIGVSRLVLPDEGYQRVVEMLHIKVSCSLVKVRLTPTPLACLQLSFLQ